MDAHGEFSDSRYGVGASYRLMVKSEPRYGIQSGRRVVGYVPLSQK